MATLDRNAGAARAWRDALAADEQQLGGLGTLQSLEEPMPRSGYEPRAPRLLDGQLPTTRLLASGPVFHEINEIASIAEAFRKVVPDSDLASAIQHVVNKLLTAVHKAANLQCDVDVVGAAEVWKAEPENIRRLCREGKVAGAFKLGGEWRIPISTLQQPLS